MHKAKPNLSKLVDKALKGEEVVIAKSGKPLVQIVPLKQEEKKNRKGGLWKGKDGCLLILINGLMIFRRLLTVRIMRYLIDTHVFIWWMQDEGDLTKEASAVIRDIQNEVW